MTPRTCISPEGAFIYGIHRPRFTANNFRGADHLANLGAFADDGFHRNDANFPPGPVHEPAADPVFEIPNAFFFRGTTYIGKAWADEKAANPETIFLPEMKPLSFFEEQADDAEAARAIGNLPRPLRLALAISTTDSRDLCCLAHLACSFCMDEQTGHPWGLSYERRPNGKIRAIVDDKALFEAVANNRHLPEPYKQAMVLRPGAQGESEIVGDYRAGKTHVFEYLRRNSYIPWGHYAANMADDAVRYDINEISLQDMTGMRHLYYQRTYAKIANLLGLLERSEAPLATQDQLETMRQKILTAVQQSTSMAFNRTLWGWNYGFDYAPSGYRLHASHQQIHQQFAMIPERVSLATTKGSMPAYACGDMVADVVKGFRKETGKSFFHCYQLAIERNRRMDGDPERSRSIIVFEDERVMVFVPKAQTSQWELQLMPKTSVGTIIEADTAMRRSLDLATFTAVRTLGALGARMITTIEYSKPMTDHDKDQRLLLSFLPKLPESPGAFSEAQLRWINGHYPEDFAQACRNHLPSLEKHDRS